MSIWPHKTSNDFQFAPLEQTHVHQANQKYTQWEMGKEKRIFLFSP